MSKKRKTKQLLYVEPIELAEEVVEIALEPIIEPSEAAIEPAIERIEVPEPVTGAILVEQEIIVEPNPMTCTGQELADYRQRVMNGEV